MLLGQATWQHEFQAFSLHHAIVLAVTVAIMATFLGVGRAWNNTPRETLWRRIWGAGIILSQIGTISWWLLPSNWEPASSLPLHVCDLAVWTAAFALLLPSRLAACIVYFWGIGLSTQAFFTPTLQDGPASLTYWWFWIQHTQIVGVGLYVVLVDGYRPTLRDLAAINIVTLAYGVAMLALNIPLGLNYGYIGSADPATATLIQRLGPWPLRLLWIGLIVETLFVLMWAIWPLGLNRLGGESNQTTGAEKEAQSTDRAAPQ